MNFIPKSYPMVFILNILTIFIIYFYKTFGLITIISGHSFYIE